VGPSLVVRQKLGTPVLRLATERQAHAELAVRIGSSHERASSEARGLACTLTEKRARFVPAEDLDLDLGVEHASGDLVDDGAQPAVLWRSWEQ
jgi:hypothetical protein